MECELDELVRIPDTRRVTQAANVHLMQEITLDEVIQAINALNGHKVAGADGLNNDLVKDTQALMAPALVTLGNELIGGGDPPTSFLEVSF